MSALQRLRERKLVQWTVAYLAGAWLLTSVFSTLREELDWSSRLFPLLLGVLALGFVLTLVLAWYHGEQGRQRVSGPELLIIGGILLVAALLFPLVFGPDRPGGAREAASSADSTTPPAGSRLPTIAVLPIENASGLEEDESFVAGIHGEVLNQLYKIRSLEPRSQTSVLAYRDTQKGMPAIAEELEVQYLVEAEFRRAGDSIRMNVRLFDAPADRRLWGRTYERRYTLENVFELQTEIAIDVATQAGAEILPGEAAQLAVQAPENVTAYERYLDGLHDFREASWGISGPGALLRARDALQEAIAAEPDWAPAHAALGRVYHFLAFYVEPSANFRRSREALDRALELDSLSAPAWASHGFVLHNSELDFEGAEDAYQTAARLGWRGPWGYAILLMSWGRWREAIDKFEEAASFNRSNNIRGQLARAHVCAGDYDTAIEQFESMRRAGSPIGEQASSYLAYAYLKAGYREEGLATIAGIGTLDAGKALAYALADSTERAETFLAAAEETPPDWGTDWVMSSVTAAAAVRLAGPDRALDYLERAVEQDPSGLLQVRCLEEVRSLEGDPRYEAVLDRVGFPREERARD